MPEIDKLEERVSHSALYVFFCHPRYFICHARCLVCRPMYFVCHPERSEGSAFFPLWRSADKRQNIRNAPKPLILDEFTKKTLRGRLCRNTGLAGERPQRLDVFFIVPRLIDWRLRNEGAVRETLVMEQAAKRLEANRALADILMAVEL